MEMLRVLETRSQSSDAKESALYPISALRLFTSERSAGQDVVTSLVHSPVQTEVFTVEAAREMEVLFLAVSGSFSLQYSETLTADNGPVVIDNSSAFRYHDKVPLIIPEINLEVVDLGESRIIANPNCTTAIAAMVLWPLHKQFGLKKVIVSTYQAASGAGAKGMDELVSQSKQVLLNESGGPQTVSDMTQDSSDVKPVVFQHQLAFNLIPHVDKFQENGYTKEEMKVVWELRKIFHEPALSVSCTAVRVPTLRAHAESITIETNQKIGAEAARELLQGSSTLDNSKLALDLVQVVDNPSENQYPMPISASKKYAVEVGRIRQSLVFGEHGLDFFVCGDQLLRGAALNAVLIAEKIAKKL